MQDEKSSLRKSSLEKDDLKRKANTQQEDQVVPEKQKFPERVKFKNFIKNL